MTNRQDCDIIKLVEAVQASFDYPKWENQAVKVGGDTFVSRVMPGIREKCGLLPVAMVGVHTNIVARAFWAAEFGRGDHLASEFGR